MNLIASVPGGGGIVYVRYNVYTMERFTCFDVYVVSESKIEKHVFEYNFAQIIEMMSLPFLFIIYCHTQDSMFMYLFKACLSER